MKKKYISAFAIIALQMPLMHAITFDRGKLLNPTAALRYFAQGLIPMGYFLVKDAPGAEHNIGLQTEVTASTTFICLPIFAGLADKLILNKVLNEAHNYFDRFPHLLRQKSRPSPPKDSEINLLTKACTKIYKSKQAFNLLTSLQVLTSKYPNFFLNRWVESVVRKIPILKSCIAYNREDDDIIAFKKLSIRKKYVSTFLQNLAHPYIDPDNLTRGFKKPTATTAKVYIQLISAKMGIKLILDALSTKPAAKTEQKDNQEKTPKEQRKEQNTNEAVAISPVH